MMGTLFLILFLYSSNAFLFDTSTKGPLGSLMTDNNYEYLIKLLMDERNSRLQLQEYVIKQEQAIVMLTGLASRLEKLENTVIASQNMPTNDTFSIQERYTHLEDKYTHLEDKYNQLQQNQLRLEKNLRSCENRSNELKEEITNLKQVSTIDQLQTLSNLQTQLQDVKHNLISVMAENQARGQDLVAMFNDIGFVKQDHALFVTNTTRDITDLKNWQMVLSSQMNKTITELSDEVGFTAVGRSGGIKSSGTTLLFPEIKTSFGIADLSTFTSTGKFTCAKEGLYIITVSVMSCSAGDSVFSMYKNNVAIAPFYVTQSNVCSSASGTILIQLNMNDNVHVKTDYDNMNVYDKWSSFTLYKLK